MKFVKVELDFILAAITWFEMLRNTMNSLHVEYTGQELVAPVSKCMLYYHITSTTSLRVTVNDSDYMQDIDIISNELLGTDLPSHPFSPFNGITLFLQNKYAAKIM